MSSKFTRTLRRLTQRRPTAVFPLVVAPRIPQQVTEAQLATLVHSVRVEGAPEAELEGYARRDFRRFVLTLGLAQGSSGRCLELGASPYFTTMLLDRFTDLELSLANYFGPQPPGEHGQTIAYLDPASGERRTQRMPYRNFNVEEDRFPYDDGSFDVVIFAEIIEHLVADPSRALREIRRVLRPGGALVLTTPNAARLENVAKMVAGAGINDRYSGYGPYGRHNREFTRAEVEQLLRFEGFDPKVSFTSDVHTNWAAGHAHMGDLEKLLRGRLEDLGQYTFIRAEALPGEPVRQRPSWLYRSYPEGELV
jgi:SAM-dependent methyltransferase